MTPSSLGLLITGSGARVPPRESRKAKHYTTPSGNELRDSWLVAALDLDRCPVFGPFSFADDGPGDSPDRAGSLLRLAVELARHGSPNLLSGERFPEDGYVRRELAFGLGRRASVVGQVDNGQRGMIGPKLGDQSDPVDAFHLGVAQDQITPVHHINQLSGREDVIGVEDGMSVLAQGADDEGDGGPVLIGDDNAPGDSVRNRGTHCKPWTPRRRGAAGSGGTSTSWKIAPRTGIPHYGGSADRKLRSTLRSPPNSVVQQVLGPPRFPLRFKPRWDAAQEAVAAARKAVLVAQELLRNAQAARDERENWNRAFAQAQKDPDHLLVCCSYCGRLRAGDAWVEVPAHIGAMLWRAHGVSVSHGYAAPA